MSDGYQEAWTTLKDWLETQQDYVVIPVRMVRQRMNEEEDLLVED